MAEMFYLKINDGEAYEVADQKARSDINELNNNINELNNNINELNSNMDNIYQYIDDEISGGAW